jgi:hypothetical protein
VTAAAVVEILVVGLQALIWVTILARAFTDDAWLAPRLVLAKEWAPLLTVVALSLAYALGVVVDRWADTLFKRQDAAPPEERGNLAMRRLTVLHKSEGMAKFLEYQRSRLRIARGMVLNVLLGTPSVIVYLALKKGGAGIVWAFVVGAVALMATLYAANRIHEAWVRRLRDAHLITLANE